MPSRYTKTRKHRGGSHHIPFFTKHRGDSPRIIAEVPLAIYQSWTTNAVPAKMKECMKHLMKMNPEFDHYLYSHASCLKFIRENYPAEVAAAYISLKPGAYKSDLWRYCILYKLGGVYLDAKFYMTIPLTSLIKDVPEVFVKDVVAENVNNAVIKCKTGPGIYNGLLISPPNNPIFKDAIEEIVKNCEGKYYKQGSLDITGPCMLGKIVRKHKGDKYIKSNAFHFIGVNENGVHMGNITHGEKTIVKQYPEYRKNQSNTKMTHYTNMWSQKNVYQGGTRRQRGGSKDIVFTLTNSAGFGSMVNFLTQAYVQAKKNGGNFSIENNGWHYGDWHDYFKSLKKANSSQNATRYKHASQIPKSSIGDHHNAIKEIFVLNDDLAKAAEEFKKKMGAPYKAVYVRRGDKTSGEGKEMSPQDIPALLKATDIAPGDNLFVMSDDYDVVDEMKELLPEVKIFTMTAPESRGTSIHDLKKLDPSKMKEHAKELFTSMEVFKGAEKSWADNRSNLGRFMKLAAPTTTILYPADSSNSDMPMTTLVDPGFISLRA
jgi:mannosyltransferase OCH1-like enzyme